LAGRIPLGRLITRYDLADFNRAAADASSSAAIVCCCRSDNGRGDFADAFTVVIASRKPLSDRRQYDLTA
jgi:hypothetical protein